MGNRTWLRSHVERCLQDIWELCRVVADGDGDYPYRCGTAACWVRIDARARPPLITVFAHAATGVPRSAKLLRELNEVNRASRFAFAAWQEGAVVVRQSLVAKGAGRRELRQACGAVGSLADDVGSLIASLYGGATPFPPVEAATADGECP